MAISLRLSEEDTSIVKYYAMSHNMTVSEFARQSMIEKIEEEYDLAEIREYEEARRNGTLKTYSQKEALEQIGL